MPLSLNRENNKYEYGIKDRTMQEHSKTQKVCNFIKQLLQAGVGLYLVLLVVFYALYFVNGYEQLATMALRKMKRNV